MRFKFPKKLFSEIASKQFLYALLTTLLVFGSLVPLSANGQKKDDSIKVSIPRVVRFDISPPLRSMKPILTAQKDKGEDDRGDTGPVNDTRYDLDPVVQSLKGEGVFSEMEIPGTNANFDGMLNTQGVSPPDTVGDIGPNHYVQMVNTRFQIFSRAGASLFGPANINTLFSGFGGACQTENAGDPVVIYDQFADRWLLSQFTAAGPNYFNCVALSTSGDPLGTYYRYAISTGLNFPDYPKYGVWSDAYYISTREFDPADNFAGVGAYAINRAQMIAGNPAPQVVSFLVPPGVTAYNVGDGLLPSDIDGRALPPPGSPNYFVGTRDGGGPYAAPNDALVIYKFSVNWTTPALSTFTLTNQLATAAFDSVFPCPTSSRNCIPQPGTTNRIDILSYRQRALHRLAYRNFGTHESLVTNQSVEATTGIAGIRWYEIRLANTVPSIFQQGTYSPDSVHRWMGSIAQDRLGNMALGYSVSDATSVFPGIRYTGRLVSDPVGQMPQGEGTIINGGGSQTASQRWGDYSSMNIDPLDDCTFWYTTQYYATSSTNTWRTRIASFRFPNCLAPTAASVTIAGRAHTTSGRALSNLRVTLSGGGLESPRYAQTNALGYYRFADVPVGQTYVLTIKSKQHNFVESVRVLDLTGETTDFNFVAQTSK